MNLPDMPEQISHEAMRAAIRALGFAPENLKEVWISPSFVTVKSYHRDENGCRRLAEIEGVGPWAVNVLTIPIARQYSDQAKTLDGDRA